MGLNARDDKIGASVGPMAAEDARKYCRDREATIRASASGIKREVTPLAMLFCLLLLANIPLDSFSILSTYYYFYHHSYSL